MPMVNLDQYYLQSSHALPRYQAIYQILFIGSLINLNSAYLLIYTNFNSFELKVALDFFIASPNQRACLKKSEFRYFCSVFLLALCFFTKYYFKLLLGIQMQLLLQQLNLRQSSKLKMDLKSSKVTYFLIRLKPSCFIS